MLFGAIVMRLLTKSNKNNTFLSLGLWYGSPDEYQKYSSDDGEEAENRVGRVRGRGLVKTVLLIVGSDGEDGEVKSNVDARGEATCIKRKWINFQLGRQ